MTTTLPKYRKIKILITRYAKAVNLPFRLVEKAFWKGDVFQKKRDIIAMRATIFAKRNIPIGATYEEQQKIMDKFLQKENVEGVKWPEIKVKEEKINVSDK